MAAISKQHLDRLCSTGLIVWDPFDTNHVAFPDGVMVSKPASVMGNSIPECAEATWGQFDAPNLYLHRLEDKWFVTSHDYIPGPGPGDFVNAWDTPEEAIEDILDFYFGSPHRMEKKRKSKM